MLIRCAVEIGGGTECRRRRVKKFCSLDMAGNDNDLVGMVESQVGVYEDEEIRDGLG